MPIDDGHRDTHDRVIAKAFEAVRAGARRLALGPHTRSDFVAKCRELGLDVPDALLKRRLLNMRKNKTRSALLSERVTMIVEDAERPSRTDGVPIQVGEHLLAALEPGVEEKDDRERLVAQFRAQLQRLLDRRLAVLAVVDQEPCGRSRAPYVRLQPDPMAVEEMTGQAEA